jgi:hypothetical protein
MSQKRPNVAKYFSSIQGFMHLDAKNGTFDGHLQFTRFCREMPFATRHTPKTVANMARKSLELLQMF